MIKWLAVIALLAALTVACSGGNSLTKIVKRDGTVVVGQVVEARPDAVVIRDGRGNTITIPRPDIVSMSGISAAEAGAMVSNETGGSGPTGNNLFPGFGPANGSGSGAGIVPASGSGTPGGLGGNPSGPSMNPSGQPAGGSPRDGGASASGGGQSPAGGGGSPTSGGQHPAGEGGSAAGVPGLTPRDGQGGLPAGRYREVAIPAGTVFSLTLDSSVASNRSHVEEAVHARVGKAITVGEAEVIPVGAPLVGVVTEATPSGKVKGRARLSLRFHTLKMGGGQAFDVKTAVISQQARGTRKDDSKKIGIAAAGGAVVGRIIGGGKKALGIGAAAGGAAGTGVVLMTGGDEVRLAQGATVSTRLLESIVVRVALGQ